MNKTIINRVLLESKYILATDKTIREIAKVFGVSKSTVHKDLRDRLLEINPEIYEAVDIIFNKHIDNRHIKGGQSTKEKYLKKKKKEWHFCFQKI